MKKQNVAGSKSNSHVAPAGVLAHGVHGDFRAVGRGVDGQQVGNAGEYIRQGPG